MAKKKNYMTINPAYEEFMVDTHRYNVLWGSAGCFDAETLVNTSLGYKRIADVSIGDMVLSFNESTKIPEYKKVIDTFKYSTDYLNQPMVHLQMGKINVYCTYNHKFYYKGDWYEIGLFEYNNHRFRPNNKTFTNKQVTIREINPFKIDRFDVLYKTQLVYDIQVEDNANYCITHDNIIVHNSGKSNAAAQKIILRCLTETGTEEEPFRHIFTVVRKYKTTIRGTVFEQLRSECRKLGLDEKMTINESYGILKFPNGAEIRCIGLDDPEKIKSLVSTGAWIEEATELDEADFSQLDLRFRGEAPYCKQIIISFNPVNEAHWIKRRFFDTPQNGFTYALHTTYLDNYFIDKQYKKLLEEQYKFDENLYRIYVLGQWGRIKTGSEFYFNFKYNRHVRDVKYKRGLPLHISFDFNVNPYISATVSQIDVKHIPRDDGVGTTPYYFVSVLAEFALPNPYNTTEKLCDDIVVNWDAELMNGLFVYGDASGASRSTRSNVSDYDIIKNILGKWMNNYSFRVPKANPLIRKRRWFINKLLYGGFNIELAISPSCKKLIGDFENSIEAEDGGIHKQTARDSVSGVVYEKYGHHADAISYFLCEAFEGHFNSVG